MDLTRSLVEEKAREYDATEPFATIEGEHIEMLPETFADDAFGWRDAEWVVQWYFRRHLGAYPDRERRSREAQYGENDFGQILEVLPSVFDLASTRERVARLTQLSGVDVPVASGFLMFMFPARYVVIGEREWRTLTSRGILEDPYPDPVTIQDYERWDRVCADLCDELTVDAWTLYRAVWRLGVMD